MSTDKVSITPSVGIHVAQSEAPTPSIQSSILKLTKCKTNMHWWLFGPMLFAIIMFLLMGTIFERRIEAFWHHILQHRQATMAPQTVQESTDAPALNPSQRTIGSNRGGTTTVGVGPSEHKLDSKYSYTFTKKDYKDALS